MKFDSIRSSLIGSLFVALASILVGSCGGGGASSPGPVGGPLQILPATGTLYAGVEYQFTLAGGRAPYSLSSSEPTLLSVPTTVDGNYFTVVPNNPGVVDIGLPSGALPVRSVLITMRDQVGSTAATSGIQVAQNFMFGYSVRFTSNCSGGAAGAVPVACAGGESALTFSSTINGNLYGNRQYRFEVVRGPFYWVFPNGQIAGNTVTTNTDHEGTAFAIMRVNNNVATQLGVFRVVDVTTGASITHVFTITGTPVGGTLTALPSQFTLTGPDSATCGTGTGDFLVFDGIPPYTATTSFPQSLSVTPTSSSDQPAHFRFSATDPNFCLNTGSIIITDSNNSRVTVTVKTEAGSAAPPPAPLVPNPGALVLDCGQSGTALINGGPSGTASFIVTTPGLTDPRVTSAVSGRIVTLTRIPTDSPLPPLAARADQVFTFTVVDSSNSANTTTIGVTAPSACPHS